MPRKSTICVCQNCKLKTFTRAGKSFPGQKVSYATRQQHTIKYGYDSIVASAATLPIIYPPPSPPSSPPLPPSSPLLPPSSPLLPPSSPPLPPSSPAPSLSSSPPPVDEDFIETEISIIGQMVCYLAAWLYLQAGTSREATNVVLKSLKLIFGICFELFSLFLLTLGHQTTLFTPDIPLDIRTALKRLNLEPVLIRKALCPKCCSQYPLDNVPDLCTWRSTTKGRRQCKEPLKERRRTGNGSKMVPKHIYSTQSFDAWIEFFLSQSGIEDIIDKSYGPHHSPDDKIRAIWESPAWHSIPNFPIKDNLIFGLYLDWFNPFTNKIAGKNVSCGVLLLCCLNLPPDIRYLPENVFIIGILPGPHPQDALAMFQILEPVVTTLTSYWHGKAIRTFHHPAGIDKRIALLPLIADLDAMPKVSGFLGHRARFFCTWCLCKNQDAFELDISKFSKRNAAAVRQQVEKWRNTQTVEERKKLATQHGVRWSPLHQLPYWDPVNNVVLGFLHNTLEGVLQYHLRKLWGIDTTERVKVMDQVLEADIAKEMKEEYEGLTSEESQMEDEMLFQEYQQQRQSYSSENDSDKTPTNLQEVADSLRAADGNNNDDGDDDDDDYDDRASVGSDSHFAFTKEQIQAIRACIRDVPLPSHIPRPPKNLGEPSHGTLKAAEYLLLFTVIFPLVIPELWSSSTMSTFEEDLLDNFYHLVACTNIIAAYSTSEHEADAYTSHYVAYRTSNTHIFPQSRSMPNHHYAMHNGDQLKWWGPLSLISEAPGERLNGQFQQIKTNRQMHSLDYTMLHQMCALGRLRAILHDRLFPNHSKLMDLFKILSSTPPSTANSHNRPISSYEQAQIRSKSAKIPSDDYSQILSYLRSTQHRSQWRDWTELPHPQNSNVLISIGKSLKHFHHDGATFSCYDTHDGNSSIQFWNYNHTEKLTGFITTIYEIPLERLARIFMFVNVHEPLPHEERAKSPFVERSRFNTAIMDACPGRTRVIEPSFLITHVVVYQRPSGTYDINRDMLVVCSSLNRGRK